MSEFLGDHSDTEQFDEYQTANRKRYNIGYREGLFEAKSVAMQEGFDAGFSYHARLSAIISMFKILDGDSTLIRNIETMCLPNKAELPEIIKILDQFIRTIMDPSIPQKCHHNFERLPVELQELLSLIVNKIFE